MRIAHVSDCYLPRLGGIERQVHDLAVRQLARGHDVEVITSVPATPESTVFDDLIVRRPAARRGLHSSSTAIRYGSSLAQRDLVTNGGYDVVHLHASTFSPMAFLTAGAASRQGIPTMITVHSLWSYATPIFRASDWIRHWSRWPLLWSAVSSTAAEPLAELMPHTKVEVLPNAVDTAAWRVDRRALDPHRVVMASVMRLAARKRPRALLRMLQHARTLVPDDIRLEARIIGDGPLRDSLQRYLDSHRMSDWVTLTGQARHAEIRELYADTDFYIAPALLESFGIAALEARSSGLPVVAHAASGISDFISHERSGLLTSSDAEMTSAIARLAGSPELLTRLARHNADHEPSIGWDDVLDRCEDFYTRAGWLVDRIPTG